MRFSFMSGSSHIRSVLIAIEYQNCGQTLGVHFLHPILLGQIKSKLNYRLVTYSLDLICPKVNKYLKFDDNFDVRRQ